MKRVLLEMEKLKNPYSGLGQFCFHLGQHLTSLNPEDLEFSFYMPSKSGKIFGTNHNYISQSSIHKYIPLSNQNFDIWHCLHQDSKYLPTNKSASLMLTIHDLNFLEKYKGSKLKFKLKALQKKIHKADVITTISKYTEKQIRDHLQFIEKPLHVIHNGNSLKLYNSETPVSITNYGDYFFSIGIISPKKNFHVLLPILQVFKDHKLILAGNNKSDYAKLLQSKAKELGVDKQIILIGEVTDEQKYHLYKNCKALLFPSISEGFGLPVIEAMSLGKPVFLSKLTSLPEVGGQEAYYFPSFEQSDIIHSIENGLSDFYNDPYKADRSIFWTKQFSWENAAKAYINLYRSI